MQLNTISALRELAAGDDIGVVVRGGCMSPHLHDGQTVAVRNRRVYLPGDVIVFRTPSGALAAHRMLGWRPAGLVTRGDSCVIHDAPVRREMIIGAVRGAVSLRARFRALTRFAQLVVKRLLR